LPVIASNARNCPSAVPPMNTTPPPVETGAPELVAVPVFGTPFAVSSLYSPSGTRQTMSPVLALMPKSSAHGGALHG
jgi:hypothetical protein